MIAARSSGSGAARSCPTSTPQIEAGELEPLRDWLREHVHRHGGKWLGAQMVERATGGPLDPEPLLRHLREKFGEIYGLGAAASSDTA